MFKQLLATGNSRVLFALMIGPPEGPFGFRVSTTRQGVIGTKTNGPNAGFAAITVNACVLSLLGETSLVPLYSARIMYVPAGVLAGKT